MNKKQGVIILSLLLLIVLSGTLALKVQGPLSFPTDETTDASKPTDDELGREDYFSKAKLYKSAQSEDTLRHLRNMMDDTTLPETQRKTASEKYVSVNLNSNNEIKIEEDLKGKGFDDAVVTIENNKVNVIVKSVKDLTTEEYKTIQRSVLTIARAEDLEITHKK